MFGEVTVGEIARTASKGLMQNLVTVGPVKTAMLREVSMPEASVILVGHCSERGNTDRETTAVATDTMEEVANLSLGSVLGKLRESAQVGLDSAVFVTKTGHRDGMKAVGLARKLGTKTDGKVARRASFRSRITPRAQSVDAMGNITNHAMIEVARVNTMHAPITAIKIRQ